MGKLPVYQLGACQQVLLQLFRTIRGDTSKSTETTGPINKASMTLSTTEMQVFLINLLRTSVAKYFKNHPPGPQILPVIPTWNNILLHEWCYWNFWNALIFEIALYYGVASHLDKEKYKPERTHYRIAHIWAYLRIFNKCELSLVLKYLYSCTVSTLQLTKEHKTEV